MTGGGHIMPPLTLIGLRARKNNKYGYQKKCNSDNNRKSNQKIGNESQKKKNNIGQMDYSILSKNIYYFVWTILFSLTIF